MKNNTEPVLTIGTIAAVIVAVASALNVVIDLNTLQTILVALVPLVSALLGRQFVTPTG